MAKEVLLVVRSSVAEATARENGNDRGAIAEADERREQGARQLRRRLHWLGFRVEERNIRQVKAYHTYGKDLVVLMFRCDDEACRQQVARLFYHLTTPTLVLTESLFLEMGMSEARDYGDGEGEEGKAADFTILEPSHPLAAGFEESLRVSDAEVRALGGEPNASAHKVAALKDDPNSIVLFGYDSGARMPRGVAPARRAGMLFSGRMAAQATAEGLQLFDAAVDWLLGVKTFREVFREEWREVERRRVHYYRAGKAASDEAGSGEAASDEAAGGEAASDDAPPKNLVGLALSGGGIRSATFSLGLLQGLHEKGLLRIFDYLSTVSGGGYVGGWWSAWLARDGLNSQDKGLYPLVGHGDLQNVGEFAAELLAQDPAVIEPRRRDARELASYLYNELGQDERLEISRLWQAPASQPNGWLATLGYELNEVLSIFFPSRQAAPIGDDLSEERGQALVAALNRLLKKAEIFNRYRRAYLETAGVKEPLQPLLDRWDEERNLRKLNRVLLEKIFAEEFHASDITRDVKPLFALDDLVSPDRLIGKLIPSLSQTLCNQLKEEERVALRVGVAGDPRKPGEIEKQQRQALKDLLNRFIEADCIYNGTSIVPLAITVETRKLIAAEPEAQASQKLNRLLLEETYPQFIRRGIFPNWEEIEPKRCPAYQQAQGSHARVAEGSLSAGNNDPVHHLRLFGNYLTPRKGLLSGDTWRATTVIARKLVLTWFSLIPLLFAFVLAGQLYFVVQHDSYPGFFRAFQKKIAKREAEKRDLAKTFERQREAEATRRAAQLAALYGWQTGAPESAAPESSTPASTPVASTAPAALSGEAFAARQRILSESEDRLAQLQIQEAEAVRQKQAQVAGLQGKFKTQLQKRAKSALLVIVPLAGWVVLLTFLWMRSNVTSRPLLDLLAHTLSGVVVVVLLALFLPLITRYSWAQCWAWIVEQLGGGKFLIAALAWLGLAFAVWLYSIPWGVREREWRKELRRNWVDRLQARLLIVLVCAALGLLLSGYGYEIGNYLWSWQQTEVSDYVAKAGGWLMVITSLAGSIYTAAKASPTGGGDKNTVAPLSLRSRLIFALTPPLLIVVLTIALAWFAHLVLMTFRGDYAHYIPHLRTAAFISIGLAFFFAVYEMRRWDGWKVPLLKVFLPLLGVSAALGAAPFAFYYRQPVAANDGTLWTNYFVALFAFTLFVGAFILLRLKAPNWLRRFNRRTLLLLLAALLASIGLAWLLYLGIRGKVLVNRQLGALALAGIIFCLLFTIVEARHGDSKNIRSMVLTLGAYVALALMLSASFFDRESAILGLATLCLLVMTLGWAIAIGWMSDPNQLSMHLFYKSRLVRAYLGASNPNRRDEEITQSAKGDDVLLWQLANCDRGAPYHLLNTTLNLVGGRDLTTAQRSSSCFVLSKWNCGSLRTGYRPTREYMDGRMTLGAAVAISGAAVSPNMGARTQTAAVSMLLTLLNVRLGYWAPTPNQGSWQSPQARLWPFYTLKEFFSQTNDLSSYCYLTDGGHFDNTGLYSLVERGCRFIILADNGADPQPCFEDLGTAIRRCRIDFSAEIELDITPFFRQKDDSHPGGLAASHVVVGRIRYNKKHLKLLGWKPNDYGNDRKREGVIVVLKPSLTKEERADLRQYALQNQDFPQQSTADLWFDEAQFESYRQLGRHCAEAFAEELRFDRNINRGQPLTQETLRLAFDRGREKYEAALQARQGAKEARK